MNPVPSSGSLHDFIASCLAASGLCVLHRPFIENVAPHALSDAGESFDPVTWPGTTRWHVSVHGIDQMVLVLSRSDRDLEQRIEWLLGAKVEGVGRAPAPGAAERVMRDIQPWFEERRQQKLLRLRETAARDLSAETEGTSRWREIAEARKQLAEMAPASTGAKTTR